MKRIYFAIFFVVIALLFSSVEIGFITAKADLFSAKIDKIDSLARRFEYKEALQVCDEAETEWYESAKLIDMVLIHDYVDSIGFDITKMKAALSNNAREDYFVISSDTKKELASIKESEYPYLENIL